MSSGPRERRNKGKDRDKADKDGNAGPGPSGKQDVSSISEDVFEYVLGVMGEVHRRYRPDPSHRKLDEQFAHPAMLTASQNLSLLPTFSAVEHLFASPIPTSFLPNYEQPRGLPESKILVRIAKLVYPHWEEPAGTTQRTDYLSNTQREHQRSANTLDQSLPFEV